MVTIQATFEQKKGRLGGSFVADTIYGPIPAERTVTI